MLLRKFLEAERHYFLALADLTRADESDCQLSLIRYIKSKNAQNELALTLYNAGVFQPENATVALQLLDTMDFNHKEDIMQKVEENGTLFDENQMLKQQIIQLANSINPALAQEYAMQFDSGQLNSTMEQADIPEETRAADAGFNKQAREQAQAATQV